MQVDNFKLEKKYKARYPYTLGGNSNNSTSLSRKKVRGFNDNKKIIKGVVDLLRHNGFSLEDKTELKISFLNPTDPTTYFKLKSVKEEKHYELLRYAQDKLGVKNIYVFGL